MSAIGNILWFIFGGFVMGLGWLFIGLLAFITIVGIPWGRACFVIGQFSFFPFGKEAISRKDLNKEGDIGTGTFGTLGNVIWFIFAGIWLAILHFFSAIICFITIIGIPFGIQHLKLAGLSLAPIGKAIVSKEEAARARATNFNAAPRVSGNTYAPAAKPAQFCTKCGQGVEERASFCSACGQVAS